jgi:hypothetical protein
MTKINFTGGIDEIKKQIEQAVATYELLGTDSTVDFEKWYESWENGFPESVENRALGNYGLSGENQWRAKLENRPRWRQWSNENGIIKGEYWRDRSKEDDSVVLSGTIPLVIDQIVKLEHQKAIEIEENSSKSDIVNYSGIPEITLHFKGIDKTLPEKQQTVVGKKSFRLTGQTDNPRIVEKREDLRLINQSDIDRIGAKIRALFGINPRYIWSKGKKQVVYHDWARGYNLIVYASSHAEGDRLIATILAIRDFQVDEAFVKYGEAKNPTKAYPPATELQVLGQTFKTPERLPEVDVVFQSAKIYLPTLKQTRVIA